MNMAIAVYVRNYEGQWRELQQQLYDECQTYAACTVGIEFPYVELGAYRRR